MNSSRFARRAGVALLAVGATIAQAAFVNAASAGVPAGAVTVRFSDLDLSSGDDVARLYRRIRVAAESSCGVDESKDARLYSSRDRNCVDEAVGTGVATINNGQLSAFHQRRVGDGGRHARP